MIESKVSRKSLKEEPVEYNSVDEFFEKIK